MRHRLQRLSWIALLAIFGLVVAPTVSRALAHVDALAMAEVCTMDGMAAANGGAGEPTLPEHTGSHWQHCPLCGLSASAQALLPPANLGWHVPEAGADRLPPLFLHAPRPLFAWAGSQPRAPPVRA